MRPVQSVWSTPANIVLISLICIDKLSESGFLASQAAKPSVLNFRIYRIIISFVSYTWTKGWLFIFNPPFFVFFLTCFNDIN